MLKEDWERLERHFNEWSWKSDDHIKEAWEEARSFVKTHSEDWYISGQQLLRKMDAAWAELQALLEKKPA